YLSTPFEFVSVISQSQGSAKISDIRLGSHVRSAKIEVVKISRQLNASSGNEKIFAIAVKAVSSVRLVNLASSAFLDTRLTGSGGFIGLTHERTPAISRPFSPRNFTNF